MELKNDISIRGTLKSVDQYLNIKLDDISVVEELKYPHLVSMVSLASVMLCGGGGSHGVGGLKKRCKERMGRKQEGGGEAQALEMG